MVVVLMLLLFFVLFMIGVPVSAAMIVAAGVGMVATGQGLIGIAQHMTASVQGPI